MRRLLHTLPDASTAIALAAGVIAPQWLAADARPGLVALLGIEAGLALGFGVLVRAATDRGADLPWPWLLLAVALIGLGNPLLHDSIRVAAAAGAAVLVPLLASIVERVLTVRRAGSLPAAERRRVRALASDRLAALYTVVPFAFAAALGLRLLGVPAAPVDVAVAGVLDAAMLAFVPYFLFAAVAHWRSFGAGFAHRPVLLPLDPLAARAFVRGRGA